MSFSQSVKEELCSVITDRDKEYACLYGMLLFCRRFSAEEIQFQTENRLAADMFSRLSDKIIGRCERHRINIPTLGWVRMKEKGYIPTTKDGWKIKSGTVSVKADRYYVSVLVEIPDVKIANNSNGGIGIDLGLKDLAIVSNGKTYKNINKSTRIKKLEKKLRREQRCLSRKYENLKKGESTQKNIQKQKLKVQRLHHKIDNIRTDYINKSIAEIQQMTNPVLFIEKTKQQYPELDMDEVRQAFVEIEAEVKRMAEESNASRKKTIQN